MPHLIAIAYTSVVSRPLDGKDLDAIIVDSRAFNQNAAVTGALLYAPGRFFQYFEGPATGVDPVYARIKASRKHKDLNELIRQPIDTRQFSAWHMGFGQAPQTVLEELTNEYWQMSLPGLAGRNPPSPGLALLLGFWESISPARRRTQVATHDPA